MAAVLWAIVGLGVGSFINALVWRTHQNELTTKTNLGRRVNLSILTGRSVCTSCGHQLAWYDLIPIVSWLMLKGRCRYCRQPISRQYPLVELMTAAWFGLSYVCWPVSLNLDGQKVLFAAWLAASAGLLTLVVYDRRWMILPNKIIYPSFFVAAAGQLTYIIGFAPSKTSAAVSWFLSVAVASGIFFILHYVSKGQWIGFGDVRLGLVTGTLLASPSKSLLMIFLASVLGLMWALPALSARRQTLNSRLPYGPFLVLATGIVMLFGTDFINWYNHLFSIR